MDPEIMNLKICIYVYLDGSHTDLVLCWPPSAVLTEVDSLQRENIIYFVSLEQLKEVASSALTMNT